MSAREDKPIDNPCDEMDKLAESILDFKQWRFKESTRFVTTSPKIIYDSEWCRVKFIWDGWEMHTGNTISILYGRLHAPDDKYSMVWNGEECHCWHREELALHFLDGRTPQYAAKMIYSHELKQQFPRENFRRRQPEWLTRIHAAVWEHYGIRLFELFDLRCSDLWEQYSQFVKETYRIKGVNSVTKPAEDKIC